MVLKLVSRSIASLLFTIAFFLLFANVFGSSLIDNVDVLETSLQEQFSSSDFLINQIAEQFGLTAEELRTVCELDPSREGCNLISDSGTSLANLGISEFKDQILSYESLVKNLKAPMVIVFALSLVFYFLGTFSVYATLFKISINTLISAVLGFIAFDSIPSFLPKLMDQAIPLGLDFPEELKTITLNALTAWFEIPLTVLNTLLTYLIAISIATSIFFYFLKKKRSQ